MYENGERTLNESFKQIKERGNATWELTKKPFNIILHKKSALLGIPKAKEWTLLANFLDPASLHNPFG